MCGIVEFHQEIQPDGSVEVWIREGDPCVCGEWAAPRDVKSQPTGVFDFPVLGK